MEDEAADIELLEQHLIKTSNISQRMTSILTNFDSRLIRLEKSILPLHKSTQALTKLAENIEATLQSIDKLASDQEGVAVEEALILRGPRPNTVDAYIAAVERLNATIAFNAGDPRATKETARLVEAGVKKMTQLYTKLAAEGSSGTPPGGNSIKPLPFGQSLVQTLQPIIACLRSMPQPATHPSHPAAKAIYQSLKDAQKGYGDMRGAWGKKCLESMGGRRIIDRVETTDGITAGREVGQWVNGIIAVADAEYDLLLTMSLVTSSGAIQSTYATLLAPINSLFTTTLTLLINLIKGNLNKHVFLALSAYEELSNAQPAWNDVQKRAGRRENELKETLVSLRGVCLRSFPEFLLDVRGAGTKTVVELGTGIHEITSMVVSYLQQIPQVMEAVGTALVTLGDGMWKMGEGAGKVLGKSDQDDERLVIEHFVYDVVTTLLASLNSLATASKKPAQGAIFHFNNVAFLRTRLLLDPTTPIDDLLGKATQDALNSNYRTAKAVYFDANFSPMIQALGDAGGRRDVKDKLARFFDALDEAGDRHRVSKVLMDDEEGKEMLQEEVIRLVVPALKRFNEKNVQTSKNAAKYMRSTPEEVERQIREFYRNMTIPRIFGGGAGLSLGQRILGPKEILPPWGRMSSSRDPRRMDPASAEQWQRRRAQETAETRPMRRIDSRAEQPSPKESPIHRSNTSRKSVSRALPADFPSSITSMLSAEPPFDSEEAPRNFVPDNNLAYSNAVYKASEESNTPRKSASRRRRSTISTVNLEFERSTDTKYTTPQIPARRDAVHNSHHSPVMSDRNYLKSQEPRFESPLSFVDTQRHRSEWSRQDQPKADRVPSPLPKVVFKEDIFTSRAQTDHTRAPEQGEAHARSRTKDAENVVRRDRVPKGAEISQEGQGLRQQNSVIKKSRRDAKTLPQASSPSRAAGFNETRTTDRPFRRRLESSIAPHDSWNHSFPSPPREENRILPPNTNMAYQRSPEPGITPLKPVTDRRYESRTNRTPSHRNRQHSDYPLSPPNETESTPPSSGVAYYTTAASDLSSDRQGGDDQSIKRSNTKHLPNKGSNDRSRRPSFVSSRTPTDARIQPGSTPNSRGISGSDYVHKDMTGRHHPGAQAEFSTHIRETLGTSDNKVSNVQSLLNSPAIVSQSQSLRWPAVNCTTGDSREPGLRTPSTFDPSTASSHMRNDDSMTFVAVTASGSSPPSGFEEYDDLSEGSHYTDHDVVNEPGASFWARGKMSLDNIQAIKRRDALLNGLGLGLAGGEGGKIAAGPVEASGDQMEIRRRGTPEGRHRIVYRHEQAADVIVEAKKEYSPPDKCDFLAERSLAGVHTSSHSFQEPSPTIGPLATPLAGPSSQRSSSRLATPRCTTKVVETEYLSHHDGWKLEDDDLLCDNQSGPNASRRTEQVSRGDARRDTWVYDEAKAAPAPPEGDVQGPRGFKTRPEPSNSTAVVWSENESLKEPLSENARRMFDRLRHGDPPHEAQYGKSGAEERYHNSREGPRVQESSSRAHQEQEQKAGSPVQEETPQMDPGGVKTWRRTISSSAYQSLLKKHGIIEMKRQDVIFELCETETAFVQSMKLVIRLFVDPLRGRGHWLQGLPSGPTQLFEWLDNVVDVHSQIASALHSSRASQFPLMLHFAETIRPYVYRLEAHQPYLVHLEQATREIEAMIQESGSKFGQFIRAQSTSPECGNMGLTSFLLKPMQRLTKYPLFFKQIWELTPRSHPDHLPMFSLYNSTNLVIKVMQEVKAREEEFKYIEELASRVSGFPEDFQLARRERRLIAQGLLRKVELSDVDKETLDGFNTPLEPSRESSPRLDAQRSPLLMTPPIPDLAKLGPITSPLFPSYHNRTPLPATPPSPYMPRRSYMAAVSRASVALSEASHISEWTTSYSTTASIIIPSEFDDRTRPDSSASSILSTGHVPFAPYSQGAPPTGLQRRNSPGSLRQGSRGKVRREAPVYVFVFTDLVVFASQTEKAGLFQSKQSQASSEKLKLVDDVGISRVLGVVDRSGKLGYEYLIQVDLSPMSRQGAGELSGLPPVVSSAYLTLPTTGDARLNLKPSDQMKEARDKWVVALDRCYGYTLRALTFPLVITEAAQSSQHLSSSSVMAVLASWSPLPKSPSHQAAGDGDGDWNRSGPGDPNNQTQEWWSRKFRDVLHEIERVQDMPVMLIGDAALTMGRGLKRVHTTDRTRRNGPQQLLLPVTAAMSSPSPSSGSSQSRKSILGVKRR